MLSGTSYVLARPAATVSTVAMRLDDDTKELIFWGLIAPAVMVLLVVFAIFPDVPW